MLDFQLFAFIGACVLVAMIPGVSTAIILRQTVRDGRGAGFATLLGNETGLLLWALASVFGLSALVTASQVAYDIMRIAGAALLVAMGVQSLRAARRGTAAPDAQEAPPRREPPRRSLGASFALGLSTCMANPKAAIFAMSFLPQFVPATTPAGQVPLMLTLLAVVWVLVDIAWYTGMIAAVGRVKTALGRPAIRRHLERLFGVVLIGLGVRVALESR